MTKNEAEYRINIFLLLLHQQGNKGLIFPVSYLHPRLSKWLAEFIKIRPGSVDRKINFLLRNCHPSQLLPLILGKPEHSFPKKQEKLLIGFLEQYFEDSKTQNFFKSAFSKTILIERKHWARGYRLLKRTFGRDILDVNVVVSLSDASGSGYGINAENKSWLILGPNRGRSHDQIIIHEYLHTLLNPFVFSAAGRPFLAKILKELERLNVPLKTSRFFNSREIAVVEYLIRSITYYLMPESQKQLFIRKQKLAGFSKLGEVLAVTRGYSDYLPKPVRKVLLPKPER